MKINIVTVASGWILQKISERIYEELKKLCECSISHQADPSCDVNFYVDVQNCYQGKTPGIDIGYFTHLDRDSITTINPHWLTLDHIFHHGHRYFNVFKDFYPVEKMSVVLPGEISPNFLLKKPCLGIFQRGGWEGKGDKFMRDLSIEDVASSFKFLFVGSGWDDVVSLYQQRGISVENITDEVYDQYNSLYNRVDYVLIPSVWEGGPMSVIEACAKGIPIISSNVGWVGTDFVVDYIYEPNNLSQLTDILEEIVTPLKKRRQKVEHLSYTYYAKKLFDVATQVYNAN